MKLSGLLALVSLALVAKSAGAQEPDVVAAEALFREGVDLLEAGDTAAACPKLAQSQELAPATGTLLALAICHETEGKLASAWAAFKSVEGRARREGRTDREQVARERAAALKSRLSLLVVEVPPEVASLPGLEVLRDGVLLGVGSWNTPLPLDGGTHSIEVRASEKDTWRTAFPVDTEGDRVKVRVPLLQDSAPAPPEETPPVVIEPEPQPEHAPSPAPHPWGGFEWTGFGAAAAGAVALGVAGVFALSARSKFEDSKQDCDGRYCGSSGLQARQDAVAMGNRATAFAIAGGLLGATGVTLFLVGRSRAEPALSVGMSPSPGSWCAHLSGAF